MTNNRQHIGIDRRIWRIAGPACLANLTSVIPGLVDNAFIGQTGTATDLGAMAVAVTFCCFVLWAFGFLRLATAGLTAQAYGAGDAVEFKAVFWRGCGLALALGVSLAIAARFLGQPGLLVFGADAKTTLIAEGYWNIRMLAAAGDLVVYVVMGWLIGAQRAGLVLALQLVLNLLNVGLCTIFVLVLHWGVQGAAMATALAFACTACLGIIVVSRVQRNVPGVVTGMTLFDRRQFLRLMTINRDIFLRTILLMSYLAYQVRMGATLGSATLAGNHILFGFVAVIAQLLDGIAQATESLTGAAFGARDRAELVGVARRTLLWSGVLASILVAVLSIVGPYLLPFFSTDPEILARATMALPWLAWSPLVSTWCFQLDGMFLGATRSREMRNGMILATGGAVVFSWVAVPAFGNNGIWLSMYAFYTLRALPLALWRGRIVASVAQPA